MFRRTCDPSAAVVLVAALARRAKSTGNVGGFGPRPLDGVRVVDMSRVAAGPYCAMVLADMGADVIKVERPVAGDDSRRYGPPFVDVCGDGGSGESRMSLYFVSLNRNKRSVCVDFRQPDGKAIIRKLVERSHVLIENYIPGTLDRHGIGYEDLRKINQKLVFCSITGYGSKGPWNQKPGYDVIAASIGGLMNATGDAVPAKCAIPITDLMTGMYAHGAILAALYRGVGDKIDCDLLSTQLSMMFNLGSNYLNAGMLTKRWGTEHESVVPYKAFKTSNGFLTLGTGNDGQFKSFCDRISIPELATDERFVDNECRVKNREQLYNIIEPILKSKTNEEWMNIFEGVPFPYGPVNDMKQAFNNEHVKDINIVQDIDCSYNAKLKIVGPAVTFKNSSNLIRKEPPLLGQHTNEILTSLGYSTKEIELLRSKTVI
ncbi:succinate--hydroxymethylglutarate CoA-transferase [Rhopalosiphum padi]|uniref:succinate--hydroxymethylglutarate CoA-transferase n=1 Tax=Rhopalosiphum padi TaxID=40932 RepID=UPI00298E735A|nr:succinate--hydroxymethylglutarate CoA-transferase [Rhopalosiphum padi]